MATEAWVTLATNDSYAVGVMVLAHSLQSVQTTRPLVVMVGDHVSPAMRSQLSEVCCLVKEVNILDSNDSAHLALLARPELGITFTKLHCWTLTNFSKCVFLDADTLVIKHCDDLFDREEFSAAPDAGWPDCFNSGVFVYRPSMDTYSKLMEFAVNQGSFDGGDQGLLNLFFSDWATKDITRRLPFTYNMTATAVYSYRPAYQQFGSDVRIVHFIGSPKPWQVADGDAPHPQASREHVGIWWQLFNDKVQPKLSSAMTECDMDEASDVGRITLDNKLTIGTRWGAAVAVAAQQQRRDFQCDVEERSEELEEEMEETPARSTILSTLVEVLPGTFAFDWFASESPKHSGIAASFADMNIKTLEAAAAVVQPTEVAEEVAPKGVTEQEHREAWERGEIDYKGRDAFDNLMKKMQETMERKKATTPPKKL